MMVDICNAYWKGLWMCAVTFSCVASPCYAAVWQWSVMAGDARAFLWIPPDCERVRGVVMGNHNMLEQGIFEHPTMRSTLSELGLAEVWLVPRLDLMFDPEGDAPQRFQRVMDKLADVSGYDELREAPVIPMGHSANATWPWNFAAWSPQRTLAVLSIKGDAPRTNLTGYGGKNPDWSGRDIDGVPGLMVMGEYEWWEDRLTPIFSFKREHPEAPLALLADAGRGHFDASDRLIKLLAMFIRKATEARLQDDGSLRPLDPRGGWLMDRWRKDEEPTASPAPSDRYTGDRSQAFWVFDREMAEAFEAHYAAIRGKRPQLLGVLQHGEILPQTQTAEQVQPEFDPQEDGITLTLDAVFLDNVPAGHNNPSSWAGLPIGAPLGHPEGEPSTIILSPIIGPVQQLGPNTFRVQLGRAESVPDSRNHDIWLLASHPGDERYKPAVQQMKIRIVPNRSGKAQTITFPDIPDVPQGTQTVPLKATSSADLPVSYTVLSGPAELDGDTLNLTPIPPRAAFPIPVTVTAWQWGTRDIQTAEPVTETFFIQARD